MWYRHRRNRWGWRGFPLPLFFVLFFLGGHSWASLVISVGLVVLFFLLVRWLVTSTSRPGITGGTPVTYQPYQYPYQQPSYHEPPYQPYQQGYQAPQARYEQSGQEYQYSEPRSEYDQYERPQAQYPQEMPPMA